jgi:hypothetical protein
MSDFVSAGNKKAPDGECLGRQTQSSSSFFMVLVAMSTSMAENFHGIFICGHYI